MARPRGDIEPRLVHAARARFLAEGVDGASLRTIAADAGTSVGMIYYYFPAKDDLFLAVVEEVYAKLLEDLTAAVAVKAPVAERLRRLYLRIGAASDEELDVVRLVVREALVSSARLDRLIERFRRGHLSLLASVVSEGVRDGTIDGTIPLPLLVILTGAVGAVPQVFRRVASKRGIARELPAGEELASLLVDRLLHGIAARPRKRSP